VFNYPGVFQFRCAQLLHSRRNIMGRNMPLSHNDLPRKMTGARIVEPPISI
jgi:hypothetical protein